MRESSWVFKGQRQAPTGPVAVKDQPAGGRNMDRAGFWLLDPGSVRKAPRQWTEALLDTLLTVLH